MRTLRTIMSNQTIKEVKFGGTVENARISGNMRDYFYRQDRGEFKGGEVRRADVSTHEFKK